MAREKKAEEITLSREPSIDTVHRLVDEGGEQYTLKTARGETLSTYTTPPTYVKDVFLGPSRLNLAPIVLGDLVEVTYDNEAYSGYVESLDTYICIRYTGRKKRFRIDDCQFIKRIV